MDMLHNLMCCYGPRDRAVVERKSSGWQIFSFKELIEATDNFNYHRKLGEGGFGTVYHGYLSDGSQVAVKKLKIWSIKAEMEFKVEVEILGQLRHKNLLSLRGYCAEDKERLIVYDYMQNSSLHAHLHGRHPRPCLLDWPKRMNIAIGSAEGLEYLHHANPHIIHRDVKSSNVLLDSDFQARVADFGFAKLIPDGATHVTTRVKGTLGYLAPEYAMWGKASESCDLYSFGILLMELVSGKKPTENMVPGERCSLADWAVRLVSEGKYDEIVDPKLQRNYNIAELKRVVHAAVACAHTSSGQRPTIHEVVQFLKGEMDEKLFKERTRKQAKNPKLDNVKYEQKLHETTESSGSSSANTSVEDRAKGKTIEGTSFDVETLAR